jgi:hypothetical protein
MKCDLSSSVFVLFFSLGLYAPGTASAYNLKSAFADLSFCADTNPYVVISGVIYGERRVYKIPAGTRISSGRITVVPTIKIVPKRTLPNVLVSCGSKYETRTDKHGRFYLKVPAKVAVQLKINSESCRSQPYFNPTQVPLSGAQNLAQLKITLTWWKCNFCGCPCF